MVNYSTFRSSSCRSIAPKNFLRTIVEEIAVEEESTKLKINSWDYTEDKMDSRNFDIEIVEGLVVKAVYGFNRSRDLLHVCMEQVRLTVKGNEDQPKSCNIF